MAAIGCTGRAYTYTSKPLSIRRLHPAQIKSRNGEERRGCPLSAREKNRAVPTTTAPTSAASRVP